MILCQYRRYDTRTETVAQRIGAFVGKDNLVLVTHRPNIDALALELVEPGGFLVLEPEQNGSFDIVGGITPGDIKMK